MGTTIAAVGSFSLAGDLPGPPLENDCITSPERHEDDTGIDRLAAELIAAHMLAIEAEPGSGVFDPIEGLSVLKYHLIGDPRIVVRYNSSFPPGVARQTKRGYRVYGVECAAMVDPQTGWVEILRKDDFVDTADPTDWLSVRYNLLTGDYHEPQVIISRVVTTETGDLVSLTLDPHPPADYRYANQGPSTLSVGLDSMYHASSQLSRERKQYYGRGTGQESALSEATFRCDISRLFSALHRQVVAAGLPDDILDRGARRQRTDEQTRNFGGHILAMRLPDAYGQGGARAEVG